MKCKQCGEHKDIDMFAADTNSKRGHKSICKACRMDRQRELIELAKQRDRDTVKAEAAAKASKNYAAPRTFSYSETWVPDDRSFYRNDGNKHIPSRGV